MTKTFMMRLPEDLHRKLKTFAASKGVTVKEILITYIVKIVSEEENEEKPK